MLLIAAYIASCTKARLLAWSSCSELAETCSHQSPCGLTSCFFLSETLRISVVQESMDRQTFDDRARKRRRTGRLAHDKQVWCFRLVLPSPFGLASMSREACLPQSRTQTATGVSPEAFLSTSCNMWLQHQQLTDRPQQHQALRFLA